MASIILLIIQYCNTTSSDYSIMADEWTVVNRTTSGKRKVAKRRYGTSHNKNDTTTAQQQENEDAITLVEPSIVVSQVTSCCRHLKASQFYHNFTGIWDTAMLLSTTDDDDEDENDSASKLQVNEIVCYGIGNFAFHSSSSHTNYTGPLWQLALALELQKIVLQQNQSSSIKTVYFDPLVTEVERRVLEEHYGMTVLTKNERGVRSSGKESADTTSNTTTVFFMPHCPKGLYENVLWANWHLLPTNPRAICMIGNSLVTYVERDTTSFASENKSCLELIQPFVRERLVPCTKKDVRDMPGYFEAAFNDTYVTTFDGFQQQGDAIGIWPERPLQPSDNGQNEVL